MYFFFVVWRIALYAGTPAHHTAYLQPDVRRKRTEKWYPFILGRITILLLLPCLVPINATPLLLFLIRGLTGSTKIQNVSFRILFEDVLKDNRREAESLFCLEGGCICLLHWFITMLPRELFLHKKSAECANGTLSIGYGSRLQPFEASAFRCYRIGVSREGTLHGEKL